MLIKRVLIIHLSTALTSLKTLAKIGQMIFSDQFSLESVFRTTAECLVDLFSPFSAQAALLRMYSRVSLSAFLCLVAHLTL